MAILAQVSSHFLAVLSSLPVQPLYNHGDSGALSGSFFAMLFSVPVPF